MQFRIFIIYALGAVTLTFLICGICSFPVVYIYRYYIKPEIEGDDENDSFTMQFKNTNVRTPENESLKSNKRSVTLKTQPEEIRTIDLSGYESTDSSDSQKPIEKLSIKPILKQNSSKITEIKASKERQGEQVLVIPEAVAENNLLIDEPAQKANNSRTTTFSTVNSSQPSAFALPSTSTENENNWIDEISEISLDLESSSYQQPEPTVDLNPTIVKTNKNNNFLRPDSTLHSFKNIRKQNNTHFYSVQNEKIIGARITPVLKTSREPSPEIRKSLSGSDGIVKNSISLV